MSVVICRKRPTSIFEELQYTTPPPSKKLRCSTGASSPPPTRSTPKNGTRKNGSYRPTVGISKAVAWAIYLAKLSGFYRATVVIVARR
ncbi:hypothetical protein KSP40_PGU003281 [Platanthera guangdongensis]|uniref:Ribosomal protein L2 n=1 Tax=Platanthera guangdongensis TaxID=2320717 RepID=A0ABR2MCK6_9ASPA